MAFIPPQKSAIDFIITSAYTPPATGSVDFELVLFPEININTSIFSAIQNQIHTPEIAGMSFVLFDILVGVPVVTPEIPTISVISDILVEIFTVDMEFAVPSIDCVIYEKDWKPDTITMEFNTPETIVMLYDDEEILFDLPETTITSTAYTDIVADISSSVLRSTCSLSADTAVMADIQASMPATTMTSFTQAMVETTLAVSIMAITAINSAVIDMTYQVPKTAMLATATNVGLLEMVFDSPVMTCAISAVNGNADLSLIGSISNSLLTMTAINGAIGTLSGDTPESECVISTYSDGPNGILLTFPKTQIVATIDNYTDEVLRYVRGGVR